MKNEIKTNLQLRRLENIDDYRRTAPEVLNLEGAAKYLGIKEKELLEELKFRVDGPPCRQVGKTFIFSREALNAWVKGD